MSIIVYLFNSTGFSSLYHSVCVLSLANLCFSPALKSTALSNFFAHFRFDSFNALDCCFQANYYIFQQIYKEQPSWITARFRQIISLLVFQLPTLQKLQGLLHSILL
ncbi:uncharacterized protein LOC103934362 [Pyrus x bretschneideri]|uniref:uncharacterized protein LOC103934362 n=1 Tax=Pyrus x bretschneideri TaxID=225117 RepID=UPI00202EE1EA|nr:uncharacterized protein LOC103934362 [Pyrus x bretschneideri]